MTGELEAGPTVSITAPPGWDLYGSGDGLTEYDIVTAEMIGEAGLSQLVVVSDQNLGISREETYETALGVYEEKDAYADVTALDPISIDGAEFLGIEAVAQMSAADLRVQYWFGEVDGSVLGIYVQHSSAEPIPDSLLSVRDSITFG